MFGVSECTQTAIAATIATRAPPHCRVAEGTSLTRAAVCSTQTAQVAPRADIDATESFHSQSVGDVQVQSKLRDSGARRMGQPSVAKEFDLRSREPSTTISPR